MIKSDVIDCIDLGLIRSRFYTVPDMKTLFDTISVDEILSFVEEVNLFAKIQNILLISHIVDLIFSRSPFDLLKLTCLVF